MVSASQFPVDINAQSEAAGAIKSTLQQFLSSDIAFGD